MQFANAGVISMAIIISTWVAVPARSSQSITAQEADFLTYENMIFYLAFNILRIGIKKKKVRLNLLI